jgi:hypothetical protein
MSCQKVAQLDAQMRLSSWGSTLMPPPNRCAAYGSAIVENYVCTNGRSVVALALVRHVILHACT